VRPITEGHLGCGSAGVYRILRPKLATQLRERKAANIAGTGAAVVTAGNIGGSPSWPNAGRADHRPRRTAGLGGWGPKPASLKP
jgi:glycolate oxidase iron-sulfur subunit